MYPGLLSNLLPSKQKKPVNSYSHRAFEQQERINGMATYNHDQLGVRMLLPTDRGMRFFPAIHVKLTTSDAYLNNSKAKPRLKWEHELQERFVQSVDALGGEKHATPKKILYMMNAIGLTLCHLKSHLQKYRIALRAPPRRPWINRKKKAGSATASSGQRGSSSSTKKSGSNKLKAESSKALKQNGNKPLKIQDVEMTMEVTSKTGGSQGVGAPPSASRKGKETVIAPPFASRKWDEPAIQIMGSQIIGESSSSASSKGKEPATLTMGNQIIGASSFASSKGKEPATLGASLFATTNKELAIKPMGNQVVAASALASSNGMDPVSQIMGNQIMSPSIFASSKGKEPVTHSMGDIQITSASTFASKNVEPSFDFETKSYPFQSSIFDIQFENYCPVRYSQEEGIVQSCNVARSSVKEQFDFDQSSFSKNLAYLNQYPIPDSNSSFGHAGGSRTILANYQMNTSSSLSSFDQKSMDTAGLHLSSLFENTKKTGSSFSSMFADSINTGSSFSSAYGNVNTGSNRSPALCSDLMNTEPSFSSMHWADSGLSFSSMLASPEDPGSSFPSLNIPNPTGPSSNLSQMIANPMGSGSNFSSMVSNPMELGSSFSPVVANPMALSSSFSPIVANPVELSSSFSPIVSNPVELGSGFSPIVANPMELDSSFSPIVANPVELGSSFSPIVANPMELEPSPVIANPMELGSSFSPIVANSMEPRSVFPSMIADPMGSSSSFSTIAVNPSELGSSFPSVMENPMGPSSSFPSMNANPMRFGSDFSSMVASPVEMSTAENPVYPGPSFLSLLTDPMEPDSNFYSMIANPTGPGVSSFPSGSSLSSMVENPTDPSLCFSSTFEGSVDNVSSHLSATSDSFMGTDFSSSVLENSMDLQTSVYNPDENAAALASTRDFTMDSGHFFHGITGFFP